MHWMKKEGIVIWLDESVDVLVKRLSPEKEQRPLIANLNDTEIATFIENKLVERHAFYAQAHYRLTNDQINEAGLKKIMAKHAS
jgi:shikimate kinase